MLLKFCVNIFSLFGLFMILCLTKQRRTINKSENLNLCMVLEVASNMRAHQGIWFMNVKFRNKVFICLILLHNIIVWNHTINSQLLRT